MAIDDHLGIPDELSQRHLEPTAWEAMAQRLAAENAQLKGVIGCIAALYTDTYYGDFTKEQIERGLEGEVMTIHHSHGGVTVMTGMGS